MEELLLREGRCFVENKRESERQNINLILDGDDAFLSSRWLTLITKFTRKF